MIRDGIALEKAGASPPVLADKTGTLTLGRPAVVASTIFSHPDDALKLAGALARGSNHPLSVAVAKLSPEQMPFSGWREIRGAGVEARLERGAGASPTARLGSILWLKDSGVDASPGAAFAEKWMADGATILCLALDAQLAAMIALRDAPKPGIADAMRELKGMGLKIFLVTGDNQRTARAIAAQAGIAMENVFAEVRPDQKADLVRQLQDRGERVAFVGDGINDAPALEQADLGIAVSEASDVANEAADIILLQSNIQAIPEAIALAQAALRTIKQNLFWAFFYNAAADSAGGLGISQPDTVRGGHGCIGPGGDWQRPPPRPARATKPKPGFSASQSCTAWLTVGGGSGRRIKARWWRRRTWRRTFGPPGPPAPSCLRGRGFSISSNFVCCSGVNIWRISSRTFFTSSRMCGAI